MQQQATGVGRTGRRQQDRQEPRDVSRMWPADRTERARLWDAAMARGVAQFWIDAGRPDLADPAALRAPVATCDPDVIGGYVATVTQWSAE